MTEQTVVRVSTVTIKFWPRRDHSSKPVRTKECASVEAAVGYWERNNLSREFAGKIYSTADDILLKDLN